ncbi:MAG: hypothetical protein AAFY71_17825 [Bacteroidota bacterium]
MKKDIPLRKVEDIILAVVPRNDQEEDSMWDVYLINLQNEPIQNALISSKGYGQIDGEEVKTSTLRHYFETIEASSFELIEPIQGKVTNLHNQYWLSYKQQDYLFDKKYTFVQGSIDEGNLTDIPLIGKKGVMIR